MKRDTLLITLIVILAILNIATLSYIFYREHQHPPIPPNPDRIIIEGLKLDDKQIAEFEKLKFQHKNQMQSLDNQQKNIQTEFWGLLRSNTPDTTRAQLLTQQWAAIEQQKRLITFEHFIQLRKLCDQEQKVLFDNLANEIGNALMPPRPNRRP